MPDTLTRRIILFVFDGATALDVTGPAEVFSTVGRLTDDPGYQLVVASPDGGDVTMDTGLTLGRTIPADQVPAAHGCTDTLIVAGGDDLDVLSRDPDLLAAVDSLAGRADRVASICTGAFTLAALGLLDGRRATTHWRHAAALRRRFPTVTVDDDVLFLRDGRYITSAGISAGIDLALSLVEEDAGPVTARTVAREMVVFMQRPGGQSQFSTALETPPVTPPLQRVIDSVLADPGAPHTTTSLARTASVSTRHLGRLFREETGTTPGRWLERVRVDHACHLLLTGTFTVTEIARAAGFGTDESLRRSFARVLETTPSDYRARFATTLPQPS